MEDDLINMAKSVAAKKGKSLSRMVADYFTLLTGKEPVDNIAELPPNVKALSGILADSDIDESVYKKHLERKYL